jgi:hypothetical protein
MPFDERPGWHAADEGRHDLVEIVTERCMLDQQHADPGFATVAGDSEWPAAALDKAMRVLGTRAHLTSAPLDDFLGGDRPRIGEWQSWPTARIVLPPQVTAPRPMDEGLTAS